MKLLFFILVSVANIIAQTSESYEALYDNLKSSEDNATEKTLSQYVQKSTFNVSAHKSNYFLPISYRMEDNFENSKEGVPSPQQMETEFQISIKYDITSNLFGFNETYTVAYTQKSYWQLYVESAYFRESNYNPEFFITAPIHTGSVDYGLKAARVGFAHMSNGQGGDNERSWNYVYTNLYFKLKHIYMDLKLWASTDSSREKYNSDLLDYLGYGHLKFILPYKKHFGEVTFRYASKGYAAELNYSYPIFNDDLFLYAKVFSGYGESLIDYNNKVNKLAIGFSISR